MSFLSSVKNKISGKKTPIVSPLKTHSQPEAKGNGAHVHDENCGHSHQDTAPAQPKKQDALSSPAGLSGVKNIIAVAAGKGGVGKSTVAVNLAYSLKKTGAKVGILDADIYGPSIPTMVKVDVPPASEGNTIIPPQAFGIKFVSIAMFAQASQANILRGPMAGNVAKQFLTQVDWGELDYLIIDYPPGTGDIQLTISQTASITGAILVTTPQELALLDVRKAVSMFKTMKVPVLGVVETMSYFQVPGQEEKHYLFGKGGGEKLARENGISLLGEIPILPIIAQGGDTGEPFCLKEPESESALAFIDIATKTAKQLAILNDNDGALNHFSLEWK
jgi:ATP-binding protein involved in chromosome partitioning